MHPEKWDRIEQIVDEALALDQSERERYIREVCGQDSELEEQVTKLLRSIEEAEKRDFLEDPDRYKALKEDLSAGETDQAQESSLVGSLVGQYRIVELIGHGGMASVFRAERADEAFQEPVALKIMRRGMDTPTNVARFQRERNILARLDHPNIARLLDGGVTEEGLPYLVMEHVDGTPLYEYCNRRRLSVEERMQLFKSVCNAVHYAHKNAVIHRDLKPSNILVDKEGHVKVLDFGIAKLLDSPETSSSQFETREGERILTMRYASPEQFEGDGITTAADIYTLGIILSELLAGVHPFDLKDKKLSEIEDQIRHERPPAPSTKLTSLSAADKQRITDERQTSFRDLKHTLEGELDAIVLKCLRKEEQFRYNSVVQLLEDLQRREKDQPLVAREDSIRYRTRKFIKRHKKGILTSAAAFILIAGIIGFYTLRLSHQKEIAQREAQKAEQVTNFLIDLIESNHPENIQGDTITVREFLNRGYKKVQHINQSPVVKAHIMQVMGQTYQSLGEVDRADTLLSTAAQMQDSLDVHPAERAKTYNLLGIIYRDQGDMKKAEQAMQKSMRLYRQADNTESAAFAELLRDLAYIKRVNGNYEQALPIAQAALRIQRNIFGRQSFQTAETHYILGSIFRYQDKYEKAKEHQLISLRIVQSNVEGPHPGIETNYNNLAILYEIQDSLKKAARYYKEALEMSHKLYGGAHHNIATGYSNFAGVMQSQGKLDSARSLLKKAIRIRKQISGSDHPSLAEDYGDLATIASQQGKYKRADSLFDYSLQIFRKNFDETHPRYLTIAYEKARNARIMGDTATAKTLFNKILETRIKQHSPSSELIQRPLDQLIDILKEQGKTAEADSLRKLY